MQVFIFSLYNINNNLLKNQESFAKKDIACFADLLLQNSYNQQLCENRISNQYFVFKIKNGNTRTYEPIFIPGIIECLVRSSWN